MPRSGEDSLAHNGVLFLPKLPEFPRNVLDFCDSCSKAKPFRLVRCHVADPSRTFHAHCGDESVPLRLPQ